MRRPEELVVLTTRRQPLRGVTDVTAFRQLGTNLSFQKQTVPSSIMVVAFQRKNDQNKEDRLPCHADSPRRSGRIRSPHPRFEDAGAVAGPPAARAI
jgi:hypothetical protein